MGLVGDIPARVLNYFTYVGSTEQALPRTNVRGALSRMISNKKEVDKGCQSFVLSPM